MNTTERRELVLRKRALLASRQGRAGFTLVELMVTMAITGIFATVAYAMFDNTSSMLKEVDQLSDVQDRMRFALERLRGDIQMAGAMATPDSGEWSTTQVTDPWVQPRPNDPQLITTAADRWRVAAVVPYAGWQEDQTGYKPGDHYSAAIQTANAVGTGLPFSSDGIIVMGAIDYPLPFEMSGFMRGAADSAGGAAGAKTAAIRAHQRGLERLHGMDPFRTGMGYIGTSTSSKVNITDVANRKWLAPKFETRLLRVRDRQGYMQFAALQPYNPADVPEMGAIQIGFDQGYHPPFFKTESSNTNGKMQVVGLDDGEEGMADAGYDAAFIDAYWYHVRVDPGNPLNSQLVRTRMCAPLVAEKINVGVGSFDPTTATADKCPKGAPRAANAETVVIADNVVDFQVWFDCAGADGSVKATAWGMGWKAPDSAATSMSCLAPTTYSPGRVRMGHVRLSLRADTERADVTNSMFENADGVSATPVGQELLRTVNLVGPLAVGGAPAPGAAAVVTLQTDFELPNVAAANQLPAAAAAVTP